MRQQEIGMRSARWSSTMKTPMKPMSDRSPTLCIDVFLEHHRESARL